jgi:hypothetical protein
LCSFLLYPFSSLPLRSVPSHSSFPPTSSLPPLLPISVPLSSPFHPFFLFPVCYLILPYFC